MKPRYCILLVLICFFPGQSKSQDLSNLFPIAHWPLLNGPEDALGQTGPLQLTHVTLDPFNGAYSNGIYIGDDPDVGSYIQSPHLDALYDEVFAVTLRFLVDELTGFDQPVFILGLGYRYLGIEVQFDNTFRVVLNNANYIPLPGVTVSAGVPYDLIMIHDTLADHTEVYLNSILIGEVDGQLDRIPGDGWILNVHPGTGTTFKGYWRDLRVYGSEEATAMRDLLRQSGALRVYPNPASSYIGFHDLLPGQYNWKLIGSDGQIMQSGLLNNPEEKIDVSRLPAGLYFIELRPLASGYAAGRSTFVRLN